MKTEVRCCCDGHLIGWLDVPEHQLQQQRIRYWLKHDLPQVTHPPASPVRGAERVAFDAIDFEVADFYPLSVFRPPYLALKSHEIPIEQLQRISSFQPAQRLP